MIESNPASNWSVTITPHRALSGEAFKVLMGLVLALNLAFALVFAAAGAWPVSGFMGLDVILLWWAFKHNFASGQKAERIQIRGDIVTLQRQSAKGADEVFTFNRRWLQVNLEHDRPRDVVGKLLLCYRGEKTEVAAFLSADERRGLFSALQSVILQQP